MNFVLTLCDQKGRGLFARGLFLLAAVFYFVSFVRLLPKAPRAEGSDAARLRRQVQRDDRKLIIDAAEIDAADLPVLILPPDASFPFLKVA